MAKFDHLPPFSPLFGDFIMDPIRPILVRQTHKAGNARLVQAVLRSAGRLDEAMRMTLATYKTEVLHRDKPVTMDILKDTSIPALRTVRNPFTRAVSCFLHCVVNSKRVWPTWDRPDGLSFRQFVTYLEKFDLDTCDSHWSRQFKSHAKLFPSRYHIVKVEDMERGLQAFNAKHGTEYSSEGLPRLPHLRTKNPDLKGDFSDEPFTASRIFKGVPPYEFFYDDQLVQDVKRLYAVDFAAYGYPVEPP